MPLRLDNNTHSWITSTSYHVRNMTQGCKHAVLLQFKSGKLRQEMVRYLAQIIQESSRLQGCWSSDLVYTLYLSWIKSADVFPTPIQTSSMGQQHQQEDAPTVQLVSQPSEGKSHTNLTTFIAVHVQQKIPKPYSVCLNEGLLL